MDRILARWCDERREIASPMMIAFPAVITPIEMTPVISKVSDPPLHQMVRAIVDDVTALAQALEVTQPVITRIMIDVCRS
jgi:hypothetical protein